MKIQIGLVQYAMHPNVEANMQKASTLVSEAAQKGAQIICLPEMYRTLYFCQGQDYAHFDLAEPIPGPSTAMFSEIAKKYGVVIIIPLFEKVMAGVYHNSIAVLDADGSLAGIYRKMHIPQDPGFDEKFYFTPGDIGFKVFKTAFATIGTLICWDQWYPEAARITALMGADILFYPTAIGWDCNEPKSIQFGQLDSWKTIQRAHGIANGMYVCAVNRVGTEGNLTFWGNSFLSDPKGILLSNLDATSEQVEIQAIDLSAIQDARTRWPFFRDRRIEAYGDILKLSVTPFKAN